MREDGAEELLKLFGGSKPTLVAVKVRSSPPKVRSSARPLLLTL